MANFFCKECDIGIGDEESGYTEKRYQEFGFCCDCLEVHLEERELRERDCG